jgi:hypothetical protein
MKYEPYYLFSERFFIESIVFDAFDPAMTLLVRFEEKNGISSQKHVFCQPNQLGKLLNGIDEDADRVLTRLVELLSSDRIDCPEVLNVESLLGHPLTISDWRLELYHPIVENDITGADEIDFDLFELDKVLPKLS